MKSRNLVFRLFAMTGGIGSNGRNTVQGTFDDLSEEEKTRAYLQFLQYHQQLEQENKTKRFQQMLNRDHGEQFFNSNQDNDKDDQSNYLSTGSTLCSSLAAFKILMLTTLVVFQF